MAHEWDDMYDREELDDDPFLFDEEDEEEDVTPSKTLTLRDMEVHGEAWAKRVDELLAENPEISTKVLLAEMQKFVHPMSEYKPTEEETAALRRADIMHTLRGGKEEQEEEEEEQDS